MGTIPYKNTTELYALFWDGKKESLFNRVGIPQALKRSVCWWLDTTNLSAGRLWSQPNPVIITTDASARGWGAHSGKQLAQGLWDHQQGCLSSNASELMAVSKALVAFGPSLKERQVQVLSDNVTTVSYSCTHKFIYPARI